MLKGIKKSKIPGKSQQQVQDNQHNNHQEKTNKGKAHEKQLNEHEIKIFTSNQNAMKEKFIFQEQQEDSMIDEKQQNMNQMKHDKNNQGYENLKRKALEIIEFYSQGNAIKVEEQLQLFDKLQKASFSNKLLSQKSNCLNQKPNKLSRQQRHPEAVQQKPQGSKGKFQYNFNYQQDQQQNGKPSSKSLKRSNRSRPIMRSQKIQDYCMYCPDNQQLRLISASNYVYLAFAKRKTFKKYWHFILAPVQHHQSTIGLSDDVLTQLTNYKKCLLQMFDKKNCLVVFFEQFSQQNSHIFIQCLAVPYAKGQDFPFFFKQSLQTVEGNWTTHNTLIKIQKQKGGLQRQIPRKIKYFYIDFSLGYGYAHVIQGQKFWKRQFCHQILATALGVQLYQVKTASQYTDQELDTKEQQFKKMWEPYDWTKCI